MNASFLLRTRAILQIVCEGFHFLTNVMFFSDLKWMVRIMRFTYGEKISYLPKGLQTLKLWKILDRWLLDAFLPDDYLAVANTRLTLKNVPHVQSRNIFPHYLFQAVIMFE